MRGILETKEKTLVGYFTVPQHRDVLEVIWKNRLFIRFDSNEDVELFRESDDTLVLDYEDLKQTSER